MRLEGPEEAGPDEAGPPDEVATGVESSFSTA